MDDASALYIGLISGTSADGIDAALVRFERDRPRLLAALTHPWPDELRTRILAMAQDETRLDLDAYGRLDVAIGECFAAATLRLLLMLLERPRAGVALAVASQAGAASRSGAS